MTEKKQRLLLGAHTSIAQGMELALERGNSIGCSTIQVFTKSNRQWGAKEITPQEADVFKATQKKYAIWPVVAHATYLINIGSPNPEVREKSRVALAVELDRCELLGIPYLVLHPGSHGDSGEQDCLNRIAENLNLVLSNTTSTTTILLETMAGQGSNVCHRFEHLGYLCNKVEKQSNIGVCFDTCHAFAAGYDFRNETNYEALWKEFDDIIGIKKLHAMHINDSKKGLGSRVDRHENIGKGMLGLEPFRLLFNDQRFFDIPKLLETPDGSLEQYATDMATINDLLSKETRKKLGIE